MTEEEFLLTKKLTDVIWTHRANNDLCSKEIANIILALIREAGWKSPKEIDRYIAMMIIDT